MWFVVWFVGCVWYFLIAVLGLGVVSGSFAGGVVGCLGLLCGFGWFVGC